MPTYSIYKLINPINNSVFYVGITNQELNKRLGCHISESLATSHDKLSNKHMMIIYIKSCGHQPLIELIEEVNGNTDKECLESALSAEKHWIDYHNNSGVILVNKSSESQKEFNSQFILPSCEFDIKLSKYLKDNKISKECIYESLIRSKSVLILENRIANIERVAGDMNKNTVVALNLAVTSIDRLYEYVLNRISYLHNEKDSLSIFSLSDPYFIQKTAEIRVKLTSFEEIRAQIEYFTDKVHSDELINL